MANTYIQRIPSSAGNRKTFTFSAWIKGNTTNGALFSCGTHISNGPLFIIDFISTQVLRVEDTIGGNNVINIRTNRKFRDTNAWYHIVVAVDTTQGTASDRVKIYVNGVQETSFSTATYPNQNLDTSANNTDIAIVGCRAADSTGKFFDGSISHVHLTDGYAYTPTSFGETDSTTGEWKIKTSVTGVNYGTNGFWWLKDSIATTDHSPNSNTFTVASGTLTKTEDCPSNVFCVLNALSTVSGMTLAAGNTTCQSDSTWRSTMGTLGMSAGKYYWEAKVLSLGTINFGITMSKQDGTTHSSVDATRIMYSSNGTVYRDALGDSVSSLATFGVNDIIGISLDCDNGILKFYKNDSLIHTTTNSVITNNEWMPANGVNNAHGAMNFGNGYFNTTAISNAGTNASNIGLFEYDVKPSDATALSTKGLNL